MTETPILDEGAVNEIEARPAYVNTRFEEMIILTLAERDALCATVKHLRAERQELWFYLTRRPAAQLSHAELIAIHKDMANERDDLQSQLEQLRAENEGLKEVDSHLGEAMIEHNEALTRLAQVEQERDAATERADSLQRQLLTEIEKFYLAIQLCKDKAAEHRRIADVRTENLNDTGAMIEQVRADTANEICSELEKL